MTRVQVPIGAEIGVVDQVDSNPEIETPAATSVAALPAWFGRLVVFTAVWCGAAGTFGLISLDYNFYQPLVVALVATTLAIGATFLAPTPRRGQRPAHSAAAIAVGIALVFAVAAGAFHSEHLLTDRDPGVYVNTGRSIARTHELTPLARSGPFSNTKQFTVKAPSFGESRGRITPGFYQLLPVLLALGSAVGGDAGMLVVPAILGAIGLLALYALGSRFVGPIWALAIAGLLALSPLQLWFARDGYSELPVQVLALSGLWLFLEARAARAPFAAAGVAGLLVASTMQARIDAIAIVAGAVAILGVEWIRASDSARPARARRCVGAFAVGLAVGVFVAQRIAHALSWTYIVSLYSEYHSLVRLLEAVAVATVLVVVAHRVLPGVGRRVARNNVFTIGLGAVFVVSAVWAFFIRPQPNSKLPDVLAVHPLPAAVRKAFIDWQLDVSAHWFTEWLGAVAVLVALVGFMLLGYRALRGSTAATVLLATVLPFAALYIVRPSITPDQPWAMRRFLPVVLPGIAIAIVVVFEWVFQWSSRFKPRAWRALLIVPAIAVVLPSVQATRAFATARMQNGSLGAVHELCRTAGRDAAVLVVHGQNLNLEIPQTIRGFCGVPTATLVDPTVDLAQLATAWQRLGRHLVVVAGDRGALKTMAPNATVVDHIAIADDAEIERVFNRVPKHKFARPRQMWVFAVTPESATSG